ncbi:hypothetical protein DFH08DRAFT_1013366, partial [Mycena albidolilacea]
GAQGGRDGTGVRNRGQWRGGCGCVTCVARGGHGRTRGEEVGKWARRRQRWMRAEGPVGYGKWDETGRGNGGSVATGVPEAAGVGSNGTGRTAHGTARGHSSGVGTGRARSQGSGEAGWDGRGGTDTGRGAKAGDAGTGVREGRGGCAELAGEDGGSQAWWRGRGRGRRGGRCGRSCSGGSGMGV